MFTAVVKNLQPRDDAEIKVFPTTQRNRKNDKNGLEINVGIRMS